MLGPRVRRWLDLPLTHSHQPLSHGHTSGQLAPAPSSFSSTARSHVTVERTSPSLRILLPLLEFLLSEHIRGSWKKRRTKAGARNEAVAEVSLTGFSPGSISSLQSGQRILCAVWTALGLGAGAPTSHASENSSRLWRMGVRSRATRPLLWPHTWVVTQVEGTRMWSLQA